MRGLLQIIYFIMTFVARSRTGIGYFQLGIFIYGCRPIVSDISKRIGNENIASYNEGRNRRQS